MITHNSGSTAGAGKHRAPGWCTEPIGRESKGSGGAGWSNSPLVAPDRLAEKQVVPASEKKNYTLLVVDRTDFTRDMIANLLNEQGYASKKADDISSAIGACKNSKIDVIIVDAGTCGHSDSGDYDTIAIAELKKASPDAKIIVVALNLDSKVIGKFKLAGADVVMDKGAATDAYSAAENWLPVTFIKEDPERLTNGKTVLIMAEDESTKECLVEMVKTFGYDTLTATTYDLAVKNAASADLILIECGSDFQCVDVLKRIKEKNPNAKVFVRSYGTDDSKSPRLKEFDAVLPAIIPVERLAAALAEHLPLAEAQKKKPGPDGTDILIEAPPKVAKTHITVLVADDEDQITDALKTMVEEVYGHTAITAADGKKGLEAYRRAFEAGTPVHVVISDRQMPELDGAGMITEIRKINPEVKFIFLTGGANASDMARLQELNPVAILEKPLSIKELGEALDKALSH